MERIYIIIILGLIIFGLFTIQKKLESKVLNQIMIKNPKVKKNKKQQIETDSILTSEGSKSITLLSASTIN